MSLSTVPTWFLGINVDFSFNRIPEEVDSLSKEADTLLEDIVASKEIHVSLSKVLNILITLISSPLAAGLLSMVQAYEFPAAAVEVLLRQEVGEEISLSEVTPPPKENPAPLKTRLQLEQLHKELI